MAKKSRVIPRDPLLLEVAAAIGAGGISIGPIYDKGQFVHGQIEGSKIVINPTIETVDTLLHECLHRLRPQWSERAVRSRTTRIMRSLSYPEIDRIYQLLLTTAKCRKTAVIND